MGNPGCLGSLYIKPLQFMRHNDFPNDFTFETLQYVHLNFTWICVYTDEACNNACYNPHTVWNICINRPSDHSTVSSLSPPNAIETPDTSYDCPWPSSLSLSVGMFIPWHEQCSLTIQWPAKLSQCLVPFNGFENNIWITTNENKQWVYERYSLIKAIQ